MYLSSAIIDQTFFSFLFVFCFGFFRFGFFRSPAFKDSLGEGEEEEAEDQKYR